MGSQQPPLATLFLLGMLVTSCFRRSDQEDSGFPMRLRGSNSRCQGQLEIYLRGMWHTVDSQSQDSQEGLKQASALCQRLNCGEALALAHFPSFNSPQNQITCYGQLETFQRCNASKANHSTHPLGLICLEPPKTTPPPTSPSPTTTMEPTVPPRLQLVPGPRGLRCAGILVFYHGRLGGTISYKDEDWTQDLGNRICAALQCGTFLQHLTEANEATRPRAPGESEPLPIRWKIQNASCASLEQCFRKVQPLEGGQTLALVCSDFQPKVQSRLVGGSGVCSGTVEVRQGKRWTALCSNSRSAKGAARWEEVCREQQCGNVSSYQVLGTGEKTAQGLICKQEKLSQCHQLQDHKPCKRVFVTCQDPNPAGLGAAAVASIILALVLLAVLLVMCGPLAYKKLVKKFRQRKQRQWIGPTGMNQNMSFHRNHTATVRRSQVENPIASHVENEYSQPPRNSQVSAYPALEGALHRVSTQPDNSSDSDYDLHGTQRL